MNPEQAMTLLTREPARVGRWCGYPLLTDELHGGWLREMINGKEDMTLLAHRGSYKTTCIALALAIHCLIHPNRSALFFRKTEEDAQEIIRQVRLILESEAMRVISQGLYGKSCMVRKSTVSALTLDCYSAPRGAAQLQAGGIGESVTGRHGELIVTDDIVNLKDRISAPEREQTRRFYMELQNIRSPGGRIINTGTPWHPEDAISLMPNVSRWDWRRTGLLGREEIARRRRSMSPSLFAANYELRHLADEDAWFREAPRFFEDGSRLRDGIAHVDAAYGGGDCTALTLARREGDELLLYGRLWKKSITDCLEEITAVCREYRCEPVWCETNGDKGWAARELRRLGIAARCYAERMNKQVKISTYLKAAWPDIRFLQNTDPVYLAQILDYTDRAEHDDAPDSAACVCRMLGRGR